MATITVTNLNNGGAGSLRAALVDAQALAGADTIVFAPNLSGGAINLSSRLTTFSGEVTVNGDINGDGVPDITISGDTDNDGTGDTQFFLNSGTAVTTFNGITFEKGYGSGFRANVIQNDPSATLTITNSYVSDTEIQASGGSLAGTILSQGDLTLTNVLIDNAIADLGDGAAVGAAGLTTFSTATTTVDRVGVSGNATGGDFAFLGIVNYGSISGGVFDIGTGSGDDGSGLVNRGEGTGTVDAGITGDNIANPISGVAGDDAILGFGGNDTVTAEGGADTIFGGAGNDSLSGGNGDDTIFGGAGNDIITGPQQFSNGDVGNIGDGFDLLFGGPGSDTIRGGFYRDTVYGGAGNDVIVITSNERIDEIHGGAGRDTLDASGSEGSIIVRESNGELTLNGIGRDGPQSFTGVEVVLGSRKKDELNDSNATVDLRFEGRGENDTLVGGAGDDTLIGGAGLDEINGGAGNDRIVVTGDDEVDDVNGGANRDTLVFSGISSGRAVRADLGDRTVTLLVDGEAHNTVGSVRNVEIVIGSDGADTLTGGGGADTLMGGARGDRLSGGANADRLFGDSGGDTITGGGGADRAWGGRGADRLDGGDGGDRLFGESGKDRLVGGRGDDRLTGGAADDILIGGSGKDRLVGGAGKDKLTAGLGADTLTGGAGADQFIFAPGQGVKLVTDFQNGLDKIKLSGVANFGQLSVTEGQGDAIIRFKKTIIRLDGVDSDRIDRSDFIFGSSGAEKPAAPEIGGDAALDDDPLAAFLNMGADDLL